MARRPVEAVLVAAVGARPGALVGLQDDDRLAVLGEGEELLQEGLEAGVRVVELAVPGVRLVERRRLGRGDVAAVAIVDVGRVGEEDVGEDELRAALARQPVERVEGVGVVLEVLGALGRRQLLGGRNVSTKAGTRLDSRTAEVKSDTPSAL